MRSLKIYYLEHYVAEKHSLLEINSQITFKNEVFHQPWANKDLKLLISLLLCLIISSAVFAGNNLLSTFKSVDLDGNEITSSYFKENDVTLVFVWGTYCGYCREEMPTLEKLDKEYENFGVLGVCVDLFDRKGNLSSSQVKKAKEISAKAGFTAPSVLPDSSMSKLLKNATSLPYAVFVDSEGNQLGIGVYGMQREKALRSSIERYLK